MKAWVGERGAGAPPRYSLVDLPPPAPGPDEVLLRVKAAALNLVDRYPKRAHFVHSAPLPAPVPGLEAAGEVVAVGASVRNLRPGGRVMGMMHGACAELACAKAALLMPVPRTMSSADAAAVPVSFLTAFDALVHHGRLQRGGSVLIQGVTTGVGLAAVQLARRHGAALIAGTSRSPAKLERVRALGLDLPLAADNGALVDALLRATEGRGVDVVVDQLGAGTLDATLRATAVGGRIVNVGRFAGTRGEIDLERLARNRLSLIGVSFRTRSLEEHAAIVAAFHAAHGDDLASAALRPIVDSIHRFDALPEAIARAERGEQCGKLVISLEDD